MDDYTNCSALVLQLAHKWKEHTIIMFDSRKFYITLITKRKIELSQAVVGNAYKMDKTLQIHVKLFAVKYYSYPFPP